MAIDKFMVYTSLGNLTTCAEYIERELKNKEIAECIREEVVSIRKYLLELE